MRPAPRSAIDAGSGTRAVGPGSDEKVPAPEALKVPMAGRAWEPTTGPVAKFGISEDRLKLAFCDVWPAKLR